jgi:hypothetical protein
METDPSLEVEILQLKEIWDNWYRMYCGSPAATAKTAVNFMAVFNGRGTK